MSHFASIDHFSEHPHSVDDSSSCSSGPDYSHSDPAYCHSEANSVLSGYSIDSWAPYFYPIRAHRVITGPSSHRADYTPWGADYRKDRGIHPEHSDICSWAIIFTSSSYHYLIIYIVIICLVSFMYFLTIIELVIPCFWCLIYWDWLYYLFSFILYFHEVIQIYQFFITLSIILFQFLYSYLLLFLKHVVSPILLELHIIHEAPLPPYDFNHSCHIEDNVQLGWGEWVEEGSFCY